jgi:hypothetical protein
MFSSKYFEVFDTPWGLDEDVEAETLALDFPRLGDPIFHISYVFSDMKKCPICNLKLILPVEAYKAMLVGDESFNFVPSLKKKLRYHCQKNHPSTLLWPIIETDHKFQGGSISTLFLAQKVLAAASKKQMIKDLTKVKLYLATIFGMAIGSLGEFSNNKSIGRTKAERLAFISEVEALLEKLMTACLEFDWVAAFELHNNEFVSLNFL